MNRTSLADRIEEGIPPSTPLLYSSDSVYDAATLLACSDALPLTAEQRRGAIALQIASPLKLACALVALDGVAQRLAILPADTSLSVTNELLARFGGETIVTDLGVRPNTKSKVVLWRDKPSSSKRGISTRGQEDTEWTLATSGTTGTPKLVAHRFSSLVRTTRTAGERVSKLRWGLVYDLFRFAGLQVFLQGTLAGGGVILRDTTLALEGQIEELIRHDCSALSATPTMWRKMLMTGKASSLQLKQVTLGGEIADDAILAVLAKHYPKAKITHIYASTEAGVAFSVVDGKAGFPQSYLVKPPSEIALQVIDGRLWVHNPAVSAKYVGSEEGFARKDGFIDTGDAVERLGDRFIFRGRANGAINVGGNKVLPEEVEQVLLSHPQVTSARVFGKGSPITGQLVACEVLLTPDAAAPASIISDLRAQCRAALRPWQAPASYKIVTSFETSSTGKLSRKFT